ncbi:hypothetical protein [Metapseudomonas otitidis]|uniref:hypothetical protein n=1 Tax=Metapseudomonas otitidis TaxID=319939 RepID=UPI002631D838|nr:hypothetical protein [Pseudomonas otitidis]
MTTAQERLDEVRRAISDVLGKGQSVRKGDRSVERAELASLRMLESQYLQQVNQEQASVRRNNKQIRLSHGGKGVL